MSNSSDDIIWQVINHQFCAFKLTTPQKEHFCRNEYNVNGVCSRITCPLANARYATIKSVDGRLYLYMKTAERQHTPAKWWERIKLSKNYARALEQVDEQLIYWPSHLIDKCKQRITRLTQVAIAERRLAMKEQERHYTTIAPKVRRREKTRERKALVAAKLEKAIEKELLDRLKSGAYGDQPLNVDAEIWNRVLKGVEEQELENQLDGEQEEEFDEESDDEGEVEFVEDDEDDVVDMEDLEKWLDEAPSREASDFSSEESEDDEDSDSADSGADDGTSTGAGRGKGSQPPRKRAKGAHIEIEYEQDTGITQPN